MLANERKSLEQEWHQLAASVQHEEARPPVEETAVSFAESVGPPAEPAHEVSELPHVEEVEQLEQAEDRPAPVAPPIAWKPSLAPEKPFAHSPAALPPRARDGFLSAKDLAAAFKLNLAPAADYPAPVIAPLDDTPDAIAAAFPIADSLNRPRKAKGSKARKLFLLLVVVSAGAGAALIAKPDWRRKTIDATIKALDKLQSGSSSRMSPPPEPLDKDDLPDNSPSYMLQPTTAPSHGAPASDKTDDSRPSLTRPAPASPSKSGTIPG